MCSASTEHYYSNSFSLEDRLQSEDRPHSPGQTNNLGVIDWIAPETLDEKVVQALRDKKELADMITGDKLIEWI
jgi:SNF2 family DNA or RNA helicase